MGSLTFSALLAFVCVCQMEQRGEFLWPWLKEDIAYLRRGHLSLRGPTWLRTSSIWRKEMPSMKEGSTQRHSTDRNDLPVLTSYLTSLRPVCQPSNHFFELLHAPPKNSSPFRITAGSQKSDSTTFFLLPQTLPWDPFPLLTPVVQNGKKARDN